ncbi:MAG: ABC transporter ATP-binding protein [Verrucomicrobia bacterium CG_4_10_14_3_um_filter_43_23]|nr:MAG: ABC transporter [Verrucomicrobia bacterium CG1_02_43_26]PIP59867.1 MAG: ABC transporter [Verrucomicrobia bacterium CG22_combo_CG10-13_8_21_14_all_43_17]PIX58417.1 MAG: ABC transporter ATP-binding protein [Verrucomicrobia bacterium CG_4_10_14_3_um_filter_43_23]PIY61565.1 MAG: ABC transporter ATP-binding protein [Verrucomicrobia bacterium CG_4_10_14_0_8_um_filter_43_34]PJA43642.1 MAG: ABC transporter ATP-binding protein [Verrucomicrobia bacterium CG_4_9_14_3_um_filter_43_20]
MSDINVIETTDIVRSFPAAHAKIEVLRGVHLKVKRGQSVSITGESGAGKTTLMYILSMLEEADSGSVFWDGVKVNNGSRGEVAKRRAEFIGFVFQLYYLIPELDVLGNVLMPRRILGRIRKEDKERAEELLVRVGLKDRLRHSTGKLSGGEAQRVAIARALINEPRIIIADEPTGSIDERHGEEIMQILLDLCKKDNRSLLLVTHNQRFAAMTDKKLVLHYGKIVE